VFAVMDSAQAHAFTFNEAFSLMVNCDNQEEIDRLWLALSAHPEAEACGWLKDRFGVSWQIVPRELAGMMGSGDGERTGRVVQAFLKMKKMNIAALKKAYSG
jgi:predicted 3-demethylubiquinone-9 3-methyltransferase (glyoxalase superfamily)